MICEGPKPNYEEIILTAETPKRVICNHDFWDRVKLIDFGDIILCQRCNQYFTKVKHMVRVVRSKPFETHQANGSRLCGRLKARANHANIQCMVRVPVRVLETDDKD